VLVLLKAGLSYRHVNGVRVDTENKLAYVGGGAIWADVDKVVIEHGLAAVAGTINHTGVGGSVKKPSKLMLIMILTDVYPIQADAWGWAWMAKVFVLYVIFRSIWIS
jgi:hypothetical protein